MDVYLEVGKKKTFAGALDWPGWCRSGKDEAAALQALFDYGPRYERAIGSARLGFKPPEDVSAFKVVERLEGDATTDFGAPGAVPSADADPLGEPDLKRFQALLDALWRTFDKAGRAAEGKELRKGPRGGGRDLERILSHVLEANAGYLNGLGWKLGPGQKDAGLWERLDPTREAVGTALAAAARGELPAVGPRGGQRWAPRYFARRAAWHLLDHIWELEDRIL